MNNTEKELLELGKKVARNYKLMVAIGAFLYGCFIFISTQSQHSQAILSIQNLHSHDIAQLKIRDNELEKRIYDGEKGSKEMMTILSRMSNDLQFIKHKFIEKGMK